MSHLWTAESRLPTPNIPCVPAITSKRRNRAGCRAWAKSLPEPGSPCVPCITSRRAKCEPPVDRRKLPPEPRSPYVPVIASKRRNRAGCRAWAKSLPEPGSPWLQQITSRRAKCDATGDRRKLPPTLAAHVYRTLRAGGRGEGCLVDPRALFRGGGRALDLKPARNHRSPLDSRGRSSAQAAESGSHRAAPRHRP